MSRYPAALLFALAALINVVALYYRYPDSFCHPQFYAEEGSIFFTDAYHEGWGSLFNTTNGYFHLFPRMISLLSLSAGIPYLFLPAIFNYACLLVYFLLWYFIFTRLDLPLFTRFFFSLTIILVPVGNEIGMNLTNIQWYLALFPVILLCGKSPQHKWQRYGDRLLLLFCAFTGPYVMVMFPVFLCSIFFKEKKHAQLYPFFIICLAGAIACAISLIEYGTIERAEGEFRLMNYAFVQIFFYQYFFPLLSIEMYNAPKWLVLVLSAGSVLLFFFLMQRIIRSKNQVAFVSFACSLAFFIVTSISYRKDPFHMSPIDNCIRNFFLPMVFLLWALLAMTRFNGIKIIAWSGIFAWFALQTVLFIPPRRFRDLGWSAYAKKIDSCDSLTIPIHPEGWKMELKKQK